MVNICRQPPFGAFTDEPFALRRSRYANVLVLQPRFKLDCAEHEMCSIGFWLFDLARHPIGVGRADGERQTDGRVAVQRRSQADGGRKFPPSMSKVRSQSEARSRRRH